MEDPTRIRPNIMLEGERQPDASDASQLRLLALVETARRLSKEIPVAPCPVRYAAAASRQAGRHHRRKEDPDHPHTAGIVPETGASPPSLRRPRPTESSLTRAPRQPRNINPHHPRPKSPAGLPTGRRRRMRATSPRPRKAAPRAQDDSYMNYPG